MPLTAAEGHDLEGMDKLSQGTQLDDLELQLGAKVSSTTIATVVRAVDLLMYFKDAPTRDLGVSEIADGLGMSKAATHRMLASLRVRGLIELDETTRRYTLGIGIMQLGLAYMDQIDIRRMAHPELVRLSNRTNETATLSVRVDQRRRIYVDEVVPRREVIMSVSLGIPYPLHAGGSSKAFLAFYTEEEVDRYLDSALEAVTDGTITDTAALLKELRLVRERGWARSIGERRSGAASVAAPVFDHNGKVAAVISVCGPKERFEAEFDACRDALLETTARLSMRLGWAPGRASEVTAR